MKITSITFRKFVKGQLRGFFDVVFDDALVIKNWTLWTTKDGKSVSIRGPQKKNDQDEYHDVAYPIDSDLRQAIIEAALDAEENYREKDSREERRPYSKDRKRRNFRR